ncbi:MAG: hypothetical protein ACREQ1_03895, partial [Woeseiaceae bacterium]
FRAAAIQEIGRVTFTVMKYPAEMLAKLPTPVKGFPGRLKSVARSVDCRFGRRAVIGGTRAIRPNHHVSNFIRIVD